MKWNRLWCLISLVFLAIISVAAGWDREKGSSLSDKVAPTGLVGRLWTDAKTRGRKTGTQGKKGKGRKKRGGIKTRKNRTDKKKNNRGEKRPKKNKRRKKGKKTQADSRKGARTVPEACLRQSVTIMRMWKDSVSNFIRQKKRMERHNRTGGNKLRKKGVFLGVTMQLLRLGGGDLTNLACAGSKTTAGARQLSNLTSTLHACQTDISRVCDLSSLQPNMTFISECEELVNQFKAGAQECLVKIIGSKPIDTVDACSCWTSSSLSQTVESVKWCKASTEADAMTAAIKNCSTTFSKCRKYEDEAITTLMSCNSNTESLIMQVKYYLLIVKLLEVVNIILGQSSLQEYRCCHRCTGQSKSLG